MFMYSYCYVYVFLLLCMFRSVYSVLLCCSLYCLCVNLHYTTANESYHIVSYHIISYHIISYHIISYHIISYHIISYHIISYHIISYHTISYVISYNIISNVLANITYFFLNFEYFIAFGTARMFVFLPSTFGHPVIWRSLPTFCRFWDLLGRAS